MNTVAPSLAATQPRSKRVLPFLWLRRSRSLDDSAGATLFDLVLYAIGFGLLFAAGFAVWTNFLSANKADAAIQDLATLDGNIRGLYAGTSNYGTGDLSTILLNAKAVPADMIVGTGASATIQTAWAGAASITGNTNSFIVSFAAVPRDACQKLAVVNSSGINLVNLSINAGSQTIPLTQADAATACNVDSNTIAWTLQ